MSPSGADPGDPFAGDGEIRALARTRDWSSTSLGPVEEWSHTLRTTVRACLDSPFPVNLWCGPELLLVYNDAYRHVLGAKHPESFARPGDEVWSEIWEEIGPMFEQIRSGGPPIYADDAPFHIERTNGDEDERAGRPAQPNAWFTFALSGVRDEDGEIVAFLNIVSESTGRILAERAREEARARAERAEARLLDVFAQAPAFMAVLRGPDHVFEYVNHAYYELVGRRELLGRPVMEALPEVRGQGFEALLNDVIETGEPYVGREVPVDLSRSEGEETEKRFVDFVYYPITDADGSRSGVVAHGSDVTEHVRARQDAQAARKEAEEANQAKSRFLASMSHELRTPINAILGYTELLEMGIPGPVNERQRVHLDRVRESSRHLLMLIDDILDLTKVEAGRLEVRRERLPVAETVSAAVSLVAPQAEEREIRIEIRSPSDGSPTFVGDEDRVRQILVNLLSNAVKFTEPGGEIRITHGTSAPMTYIAVADTGVGIEPERIEGLFEPFTQGETNETRGRGGTGLGLAISRKLAELMGGHLTAESEPGKGSTFTLWLPDRESLPANT